MLAGWFSDVSQKKIPGAISSASNADAMWKAHRHTEVGKLLSFQHHCSRCARRSTPTCCTLAGIRRHVRSGCTPIMAPKVRVRGPHATRYCGLAKTPTTSTGWEVSEMDHAITLNTVPNSHLPTRANPRERHSWLFYRRTTSAFEKKKKR